MMRMPAEWEPHRAVWLALPSYPDHWPGGLDAVRSEFAGLCRAIAGGADTAEAGGGDPEMLEVLACNEAGKRVAEALLEGLPLRVHMSLFSDIWLRDTGPVFVFDDSGALVAQRFEFNGWGNRYLFPDDVGVSSAIAKLAGCEEIAVPLVFEGGSIEVDGQGSALTTEQCLLNANRNPGLDRAGIERRVCEALGIETLLWLGEGLARDHTDGHVDTLARFSRPGTVLCMEAHGAGDPNREALAAIRAKLTAMRDARGRRLEVVSLPSPGAVTDAEGELLPASYLNFFIGNRTVVVPVYGSPYDQAAVDVITACFPERRVIASPAMEILSGGGAFHCITQQEPARPRSAA